MTSKKLSDVMKAVLDVTDGVLGRPASRSQVIQVLELIESFEAPVKPATTATTTKFKVKKTRSYIPWQNKTIQNWFNSVLDGDTHIITFDEMTKLVPQWRKINRSSLRNRFREEAIKRGYKQASVKFGSAEKLIAIQAIK